jgi:hypothetical protein
MAREQFVKELPLGEIELHGETETYQYPVKRITGMQISHMDHPYIREKEAPYWILRVILTGVSDIESYSEERIIFTSPTDEGVESIRAQINQIRYSQKGHQSGFKNVFENTRNWIVSRVKKIRGAP